MTLLRISEVPVAISESASSVLVVVGAGELGARVGRQWVESGGECIAVTKSENRHLNLREMGMKPVVVDSFEAPPVPAFWLFSTPGSQNQLFAMQTVGQVARVRRAVFCSSTVVFRDNAFERKQRATAAERAFYQWSGTSGVVVRLGGLYRSGRGPFNSLRRGRVPPAQSGERLLPLIHYDDAATAVSNALRVPTPKDWYAVASKPIPTRREFYRAAEEILGVDVPMLDGNSSDEKRFELQRTFEDLLQRPLHPNWRDALR